MRTRYCSNALVNRLRSLIVRMGALIILLTVCLSAHGQTGSSSWVRVGTDGRLQYTPDSKGNTIPDFGMVGYKMGEKSIPTVPVVKTLTALSGDNLAQIQSAINEVSARTPDANGFRGAILLKAGEYDVSNTLNITASGVVLRGEGNTTTGTRVVATRTAQHTLVNILGGGSPAEVTGTRKRITDAYVPCGAKSFNVESAAGFSVGENVILRIEPKDAWITVLNMAQFGWTPDAYNMSYHRTITKIEGNKIFLNAPVVDPIDVNLKDGFIYKFTWSRIEQVGIENIRFSSTYTSTEDENHGWTAISIDRAQHCWVRDCNFYHWGYSAVFAKEWAVNTSIINCENREPISQTTGGRKYSFNVNGQLTLVKDCYTHSGRHDYVTGSTTAGPNAFVNCRADNMRADIGPHHRWATGLLFDNVIGSGEQNVQNRGSSGSGHGWAGAQTLFWNCTSSRFRNQKPPQHLNWAIGCKGIVTDDGNYTDGNPGIWESTGNFIAGIQSLYEKQLQDRQSNVCQPVTASSDDGNGNVAANVLDGDLITRWSANGDGQWLQFCLSSEQSVSGVKIAFYNGDTRVYTFDVQTSLNGSTWSSALTGAASSGTSLALQTFNFSARTAKYVKITGHSSNVNTWNSYTEVEIVTGPSNADPTVSITSPTNNSVFTAPATINISASASDSDGTIAKVEFFQGATKLGEDLTSPYSFAWSGVQTGTYSITAKATDNDGATKTSGAVNVNVQNAAPLVSISSPANGSTFTAPASVDITASASDPNGSITRVEFYQGATKLGEDLTSPYTFTWSNVAQGSYSLTARATDNEGAVTTSSSIAITVNAAPAGLPAPWQNQDIGAVAAAGSATYSNGTFTVNASGADIWGTADEFHYVYQTVSGDAEITARVTSLSNTHAWTKAGVMIRETTAANSSHAMLVVSPSSGIAFQRRATTAGTSTSTAVAGTAPLWLKVKRTGTTFTASSSSDGITWTTVGTATITMTSIVQVGLALTSHVDGTLATASFSNVSVFDPSCVAAVASADDGNVAANVLDNDFNTRWSASGDPQWIQFCLGSVSSVSGVQIAFYKGNERSSRFDVQVSTNGTTFSNAATGLVSSGTSLALETFNFAAQNAKYVRIVGHGNTLNLWNSYTEVRISSSSSAARTGTAQAEDGNEEANPLGELSSYPTPANDQITIIYEVKKAGRVRLGIYNGVNSQTITLVDEELSAGTFRNTFDIRNLPNGVHVIKLIADGKISTRKLLKR